MGGKHPWISQYYLTSLLTVDIVCLPVCLRQAVRTHKTLSKREETELKKIHDKTDEMHGPGIQRQMYS